MFLRRYLLVWNEDAVFVFEPDTCSLVTWTQDLSDIVDIGLDSLNLFVLYDRGLRLASLQLLPVGQAFQFLTREKAMEQAAMVCVCVCGGGGREGGKECSDN